MTTQHASTTSPTTDTADTATGASQTPVRPAPLPPGPIRLGPDGDRFVWGPIQAIHEVGTIQVVEYLRDTSNHSASQPEAWLDHGRTYFHAYLDNKSTSHSFHSLDSALVGAIAIKRKGLNPDAAHHFDLMTLGVLPGRD